MDRVERARRIKAAGSRVGFDRVGITSATHLMGADYYREWLERGYAGTMSYLHANTEERVNPGKLLSGACTVICVARSYAREGREDEADSAENGLLVGRVARYARGGDYHVVLRRDLHRMLDALRGELDEPFDARVFVDTGPLLERELARNAGLGWIGKNTMLMHERLGSYLFLAEAITTIDAEIDAPLTDHCGSCTRCLDACPTQAFPSAYQMDASRCVSYFTIEHRGEVPPAYHQAIGDWVYGCDICQEVCPFNRKAPLGTHAELAAAVTPARVDLLKLISLRSGDYRRLTDGSASRRARRSMWRRNAIIALGNVVDREKAERSRVEAALARCLEDEDDVVRSTARRVALRVGSDQVKEQS